MVRRARVRGVTRRRRRRRRSLGGAVRSLGVLLRKMPFHVKGEVIAPGEGTLAHGTLEGFRASMLSIVTS